MVKDDAIISNNYLVGRVIESYPEFSKVELITNRKSSFTAKISGENDFNGVVKGQGEMKWFWIMFFLTKELKKGMDVLTKGDKDEKGNGYPPDILIGKIETIEKNQSDLFQRAEVLSPVDFKNLKYSFRN